MIMHKVTTLNQFIIERQAEIPGATGEFSRLLHHIGIAAKKVHREVNKAGLVDILGKVGSINVQGEDQQKLDVYADKTFMDELRASGECCGVATEENQDIVVFEEGLSKDGKYWLQTAARDFLYTLQGKGMPFPCFFHATALRGN